MKRQPLNLPSGKEHNWPWRNPEFDIKDSSTFPPFPGMSMMSAPFYMARVVSLNPEPPFGNFYWIADAARIKLLSISAGGRR